MSIHLHIHLLISHPTQKEGAEGGNGPEERNTAVETKTNNEMEELPASTNPVDQLDFYKPDPFVHCQSDGRSQALHIEIYTLRCKGSLW